MVNFEKVDLIIQARMGSTRLPGKSLFDLAGEPLVGRIIERVKRCKRLNDIILAIPNNDDNLPLREIALRYNIKLFLGSENDLVSRYYKAAKFFETKFICRLPADNPTPEPSEFDRLIDFHLENNVNGFSTNICNVNNSGYPDGIGVEIFRIDLLERIYKDIIDPEKREHVHLNFFNYKTGMATDNKLCPVKTIKCPKSFRRPELVLDVNTEEQYIFMKKLYEYLYPRNKRFSILDIINWYDNVYLREIS